jgi:hypothetical protein
MVTNESNYQYLKELTMFISKLSSASKKHAKKHQITSEAYGLIVLPSLSAALMKETLVSERVLFHSRAAADPLAHIPILQMTECAFWKFDG